MKIVAVSQRVDEIPDRGEVRDALDHQLFRFLQSAECLPFPIPNTLFEENMLQHWLDSVQPDAIILSGGNHIGQQPLRDATEIMLLDYAEKKMLPVLGLCRGMQIMAMRDGAELISLENHVACRHTINGHLQRDSVNSYHHYGFICCPNNFDVLASSADGVIEAMQHKSLPWEAWMWHPERDQPFYKDDIMRIRNLFYA